MRVVRERTRAMAVGGPERCAGKAVAGAYIGQRYRCHDDVATEAAGDEMLLVHLGNGRTFRLNRTGAAIWELARAGLTPREIAETLRRSFAVPLARLEADASGLMTELAREGLLELLKKGGS